MVFVKRVGENKARTPDFRKRAHVERTCRSKIGARGIWPHTKKDAAHGQEIKRGVHATAHRIWWNRYYVPTMLVLYLHRIVFTACGCYSLYHSMYQIRIIIMHFVCAERMYSEVYPFGETGSGNRKKSPFAMWVSQTAPTIGMFHVGFDRPGKHPRNPRLNSVEERGARARVRYLHLHIPSQISQISETAVKPRSNDYFLRIFIFLHGVTSVKLRERHRREHPVRGRLAG